MYGQDDLRSHVRCNKGKRLDIFLDDYVVIDTETTGYDPSRDEIIELAALKVCNGEITDSFESLICPNTEVDDFITELTGITNEMLLDAPCIEEVLPSFIRFIGENVVVGHNAHFDVNFIYDNLMECLEEPFENDFVDTLYLSRKLVRDIPNHKLSTLAEHFRIENETAHRALADCETTHRLYKALKEENNKACNQIATRCENKENNQPYAELKEESSDACIEMLHRLDGIDLGSIDTFRNKEIVFKGKTQAVPYAVIEEICTRCGARPTIFFEKSADVIVFGCYTYRKYKRGDLSGIMKKADRLAKERGLIILSEDEFYEKLGLSDIFSKPNVQKKRKQKTYFNSVNIKELSTDKTEFDEAHPLYGKVCVFTGTLEKMPRKDAMQLVIDFGGTCGSSVTEKTNYLVLGNNDYCPLIKDGKSSKQKKAEKLKLQGHDIEIISENVFYDMVFKD